MEIIDMKKLENWDLMQLKSYLNIKSQNDFRLIVEAYRRKNYLNAENKFLGLGLSTEYKSKYFKPSFPITPRANNWYTLNSEGWDLLNVIEKYLPIPSDSSDKIKVNTLLFTYK